jgi:hypothetical protein
MLYVEFENKVIEKHPICSDLWEEMGSMVAWLIYDRDKLNKIVRFLYVVDPPTGGYTFLTTPKGVKHEC